jgi:hypothetical protein
MSAYDPAALTDALLVVKGTASPSRPTPPRTIRRARDEARMRVAIRLEETHHRRLRLAAAHMHKSVQAVLQLALDHYLERIVPNVVDHRCLCLARRAAPDAVTPVPLRTP